jgi:hypothetical protein
MMAFLNHWLLGDLWSPMWPNIFAPSAFSIGAVALSHLRLRAHVSRQARQTRAHCDGCTCAGERP